MSVKNSHLFFQMIKCKRLSNEFKPLDTLFYIMLEQEQKTCSDWSKGLSLKRVQK